MHPKHPMRDGFAPDWAHGVGYDRFGPFAEVYVGEATLVMRWIPAGTFMMGSPTDEAGRDDDEQQHTVELTEPFWMADTPVTQALWTAVMGANPSRFQHPDRPVEQVSWTDATQFIERLNALLPDLQVRLPTEAQWEYACRAGTQTATYAGDLEILGKNNAPLLDAIAWYGGNSGVDFDLAEGHSAGWSEKQYTFDTNGTRIVRRKAPNAWGLYDMLGNVWEWCADWFGSYDGDAVDPKGPEKGVRRVVRGGSWYSTAGSVRAAYRYGFAPGFRGDSQGFRLSRGPAPSARSAAPAERAGAEPRGMAGERSRSGAEGPRGSGGAAVAERAPGGRGSSRGSDRSEGSR